MITNRTTNGTERDDIDESGDTIDTTRRAVLAAGGVVALAGTAGCLTSVAGAVTNTGASPAGVLSAAVASGGSSPEYTHRTNRALDVGDSSTDPVPASVRAGDGFLSGEVELEGWSTTTTLKTQDYNSVRSNKRRSGIGWWEGDDEWDDDADTLATVLELERGLLVQVEAARERLARRSTADVESALAGISHTIDDVEAALEGCPTDVCATVRANAEKRHRGVRSAADAVEAGAWEEADERLGDVRAIVESDVELLEAELGADGERAADEELFAYLGDESVIGERFTVCLPDARLPRDGPAIADELTPRRILDYLTGAAERCVADGETLYCWGQNLALHAELSEPPADGPGVAARAVPGGVVVTNSPPVARDTSSALVVPDEGDPYAPDDLESWGEETRAGEVWVTPTLVCPIVARPADAPTALPATLFLRRCRHDDQYLYTGGWIVDDAALFADSCTLLVAEGPNEVVAFSPSDVRGGERARREALGRMRRERSGQGAAVYDGALDADALVHLPEALSDGEGLEGLLSLVEESSTAARTGRNPQTGKEIKIPARDGPADGEDETVQCLVVPLDCPLAHLTDADDLSSAETVGAYDAFLQIQGVEGES